MMYDSEWVSLEHVLLSRHLSQTITTFKSKLLYNKTPPLSIALENLSITPYRGTSLIRNSQPVFEEDVNDLNKVTVALHQSCFTPKPPPSQWR